MNEVRPGHACRDGDGGAEAAGFAFPAGMNTDGQVAIFAPEGLQKSGGGAEAIIGRNEGPVLAQDRFRDDGQSRDGAQPGRVEGGARRGAGVGDGGMCCRCHPSVPVGDHRSAVPESFPDEWEKLTEREGRSEEAVSAD